MSHQCRITFSSLLLLITPCFLLQKALYVCQLMSHKVFLSSPYPSRGDESSFKGLFFFIFSLLALPGQILVGLCSGLLMPAILPDSCGPLDIFCHPDSLGLLDSLSIIDSGLPNPPGFAIHCINHNTFEREYVDTQAEYRSIMYLEQLLTLTLTGVAVDHTSLKLSFSKIHEI